MTHHPGGGLAELGFLLVLFAGAWLAAAEIPQFKFASGRSIVGGLALAAAGLLLIIAVHWGKFGYPAAGLGIPGCSIRTPWRATGRRRAERASASGLVSGTWSR